MKLGQVIDDRDMLRFSQVENWTIMLSLSLYNRVTCLNFGMRFAHYPNLLYACREFFMFSIIKKIL